MRKLHLDFQQRQATSSFAWTLLIIGVLGLGGTIVALRQINEETQTSATKLRAAEKALSGAATPATKTREAAGNAADDAALAAARRVLTQVNVPWEALFATLEKADNADVALLAVTPDVRKSELRIFAEARNLAAMLAYYRHLENSGLLRNLSLTDHEIVTQDPLHPVRFNLVGTWVMTNAHP